VTTITVLASADHWPASTRSQPLRIALEEAENAGAVVELLDLRQLNLPEFPDQHDPPDRVVRILETSHNAHGFLWSGPLYDGTIGGTFKECH